jgi:acyl homoserine lactone synthase
VHAHRAGPPAKADGKPIFACWIEIDEQTTTALGITLAESQMQTYSDLRVDTVEQVQPIAARRQVVAESENHPSF